MNDRKMAIYEARVRWENRAMRIVGAHPNFSTRDLKRKRKRKLQKVARRVGRK